MRALSVDALGEPRAAAYVESRLAAYEFAVCAHRGERLLAFALMDAFSEAGARHAYIGPLFARLGTCLSLLTSWIPAELEDERAGALHFAAEIENARLLGALQRLFPHSLSPRPNGHDPASAGMIAERFVSRVRHIQGFDPTNWSTLSTDSLYCARARDPEVEEWLERRGVHLHSGRAQLVVLSAEDSRAGRQRLVHEMPSRRVSAVGDAGFGSAAHV
jgi:hypothetical protein